MLSSRRRTLLLAALMIAVCLGCRQTPLRGLAGWRPLKTNGTARIDQIGPPAEPPRVAATPPTEPRSEPDTGPLTAPVADDALQLGPVVPADPMELLQQLNARLTLSEDGGVIGVDLSESGVRDADLVGLTTLGTTRQMNLRGTAIGDAGLASLAAMQNLEFLGLTGTNVTDRGLESLQNLNQLRFLTLGQTHVTDAAVDVIGKLPRLEGLNLLGTEISPQGVHELGRKLPNCRIVSEHTDDVELPLPDSTRSGGGAFFVPHDHRGEQGIEEPRRLVDLNPTVEAIGSSEQKLLPLEEAVSRKALEEHAQQRLVAVLDRKLHDPDVLRAVADLYMSQQRWHEARQILRLAEPRLPADKNVAFDLAVVEARCGNYSGAFALFESVMNRGAAHYNCGVLMYESGKRSEALHEFEKALVCDPHLEPARQWLAIVKRPFGDPTAEPVSPLMSDEQIRRILNDTFPPSASPHHQVGFGARPAPAISPAR